MIVERNVFYAKYGQGDALLEVIREFGRELAPRVGMGTNHVYTDLTGTMFQITWDTEFKDIAEFAEVTRQTESMFGDAQFQRWFAKMQPLVERGERQLLQSVEM